MKECSLAASWCCWGNYTLELSFGNDYTQGRLDFPFYSSVISNSVSCDIDCTGIK